MRRSSTRRPVSSNTTGTKAATKELERVDLLFGQYADKNEDCMIGPDGIQQLCRDLGVEHTDIRVLLLAWKFQAARQGFFSQEEWRRGLKALRADTIDKLKKSLSVLQQEIMNPDAFKDFYIFAFQYCLTEPRQKTLDVESACLMLELVLGSQPHVSSFTRFLQEQKEYKVLTLDQWTGYLRFCEEINHDFSNYDENQAWPLLLDNYVEWARKQ